MNKEEKKLIVNLSKRNYMLKMHLEECLKTMLTHLEEELQKEVKAVELNKDSAGIYNIDIKLKY